MTEPNRVDRVLGRVFRDPVRYFIRGWNWKSALVSSMSRALIFLAANLPAGLAPGLRAMVTELAFRAVASGVLGSLTQALGRAEPPWAAAFAALLIMPAAGHLAEYAVHVAAGTPRLAESITASVVFTCFTTLANLFVMREGALIVGEGQRPLREDLRTIASMLARLFRTACRIP